MTCQLKTSNPRAHGNTRQMGHEPHLIRLAISELELEVPASQVTEQIVVGKIMEVKGKLLQLGFTQKQAITLTLEEYQRRLMAFGRADKEAAPIPNPQGYSARTSGETAQFVTAVVKAKAKTFPKASTPAPTETASIITVDSEAESEKDKKPIETKEEKAKASTEAKGTSGQQ